MPVVVSRSPVRRAASPAGPARRDTGGAPPGGRAGRRATKATPPAATRRSAGKPPARPAGSERAAAPSARQTPGPRHRSGSPTRAFVAVIGGVVWAVAVLAAVSAGTPATAALLIPIAVVASVSAVMTAGGRRPATRRRGAPRASRVGAAAIVSLVVPLAALAGPYAAIAALAVVGGMAMVVLLASIVPSSVRPARLALTLMAASLGPAVAAAAVILARGQGSDEAVALVAGVLAYDVGAFLMGNARTGLGGVLGVAGGAASVAVVAVAVAAVMDPPFSGRTPWTLFALVAVLAPVGVALAGAVAGRSKLPALRRLDSLTLAAPAWVVGVAVILHR